MEIEVATATVVIGCGRWICYLSLLYFTFNNFAF